MDEHDSSGSLRRLVLPQPVTWTRLQRSRAELEHTRHQLDQAHRTSSKLENITDEPTWDAYIPLGPLAFFKGQLAHTNDITLHLPTPTPFEQQHRLQRQHSTENDIDASLEHKQALEDWRSGEAWSVLKSAKQARESVARTTTELEQRIIELENLIVEQEREHKTTQKEAGNEDWTFNDNGEVINEEGLPMFDIREELPPESLDPATLDAEPVVKQTTEKPKMRYLIKKGGKQVVKPLNMPSTPSATPLAAPKPAAERPTRLSETSNAPALNTKAILDELEQEEALEAAQVQVETSSEVAESTPKPESSATETKHAAPASTATPSTSTKAPFLPGFAAGFLSKKTRLSSDQPSEQGDAVVHEPRHHVATPTKSIYRPTPPASTVASRSASPKPDRQVTFDLPSSTDVPERESKPKRTPIILGPPPSSSIQGDQPVASTSASASASAESTQVAKDESKKKEPFVRPIKESVVERPLRAPTAPKPSKTIKSLFQSDRVDAESSRSRDSVDSPPIETSSSSLASSPVKTHDDVDKTSRVAAEPPTPVHTISLSSKMAQGPSEPGHASLNDLDDDYDLVEDDDDDSTQGQNPSLTEDHDSDSSDDGAPLYDDDDDDDEEEQFDMDFAMHQREVALAFHERRSRLVAGAGTGALGGELDPEAYNAWNQPDVPVDASVQGPGPASGRSSRFRTGRLESTRMIIPTLLENNIRSSNQEDGQGLGGQGDVGSEEEDDDGLTEQERQNVRENLEAIKRYAGEGPLPSDEILKSNIEAARFKAETGGRQRSGEGGGRAPPAVKQVSKKITEVHSEVDQDENTTASEGPGPSVVSGVVERSVGDRPSTSSASAGTTSSKPKKMSRFKARQLGLEPSP
ncbi:hypothetical protein ACM66B_001346 [Microbotryomycetes sp. NB124-2]